MDPTCRVRPATAEDAEVLARLHLECWRETYAHLLSPGFVAGQGVEGRLAMWRHLPRAQAFYQRNRFVFTGAMDTIEHWEGLPEVRMARPAG